MGAQLVGTVPLRLQQQAVVVDVTQAVGIAVRFDGEHLRQVGYGGCGCLEEQGLVAIQGSILQPDDQVGLVAGHDEVAVIGECVELFG